MSLSQLPEHYQTQFSTNWEHLLQQEDSMLGDKCRRATVNGKERQFSQLGKGKMRLITTRNGTTIPSDSPMAKRWVRPKPYDEVTHIDEFDEIALGDLPKPQGEMVQVHAMAAHRTIDEVIINGLEGTSYVGVDGTTAVDVPASQKVAVNYGGANSGLTLAKILRAKYILDKNEVPAGDRYFLVSAQQINDLLLNVNQISSGDYNNVRALVDGVVNKFAGFWFVQLELLTLDVPTDVRTCIAYHKSGVLLGEGQGRRVLIDILPQQNHTIQIRTTILIGATRMEEEKVVLVYCDESP